MNKTLLSLGIMLSMATSAFGWGQKGHDVTAYIAEQHLTPTAKAAVDSIYDGKSLVYWANWPDNACHTPEYAYTKTWHYRNIDAGNDYDAFPRNENGDVTTAIKQQYAILANPNSSKDEKKLALILLVHFCGDIHQPMHMGHLSDLGGNKVKVKFFGRNANLHSVWDSSVLESGHNWSFTEWQKQIDRISKDEEAKIIKSSDPDDWGKECYSYATKIYESTPEGTEISYDYVSEWTPLIEQQLLKGGLRLADLLNSLFDPNYSK
ncbi:MAG: S1/P1 nuclease [Muribaculum sp.]|nr:S1/P1 nuclease [Muribaculum sp.]